LSDIIKSFVALAFVIKIDDWFSENFPNEIKECASNLKLVIGEDQNSMKKIVGRLKSQYRDPDRQIRIKEAIANCFINLQYTLVNNFYIIIYYYFFPLVCIIL